MTVRRKRAPQRCDVTLAPVGIHEEMQHGPVVPERKTVPGLERDDVANAPVDSVRALPESLTGLA